MANIQYYDVILKPVVTEKSMSAMAEKKYTFFVHPERRSRYSRLPVEADSVRLSRSLRLRWTRPQSSSPKNY